MFILVLSLAKTRSLDQVTPMIASIKQKVPAYGNCAALALGLLPSCLPARRAKICRAFKKAVNNPIKLKLHAKSLLSFEHIDYLKTLINVMPLASPLAWAQTHKSNIVYGQDQETILIQSPPVFRVDGKQEAGSPVQIIGNKPYVAELRDITIYPNSSIMVTADGTALSELALHPRFGALLALKPDPLVLVRNKTEIFTDVSTYKVEAHPGGICLSGFLTNAFGHFVPEYVSKLLFLEDYPDFVDLPLIVDEAMPQSHFDYIAAVVSNPIVRLPPQTAFRCDRLLVAPPPTFHPYEILDGPGQHENCASPRSLRYLRERVLTNITGKSRFGEKIYLSRRNSRWRKLENEEEIQQWLEIQGFETVYAEELSFADQVRTFRNAKTIVAPNGSALMNIIFSSPGTKIFVLSAPNLFNWGGFYGPMNSLGYHILFVAGPETTNYKHANYSVPVEHLRRVIEQTNG